MGLGAHIGIWEIAWLTDLGVEVIQAQLVNKPTIPYPSSRFRQFDVIESFRTQLEGKKLYIHAPFTVALKSESFSNTQLKAIERHMEFLKAVGGSGFVMHVARYLEDTEDKAIEQYRKNLEQIKYMNVPLILENSAGSKSSKHLSITGLMQLVSDCPFWVGWCLDVAHAYADGFDVNEINLQVVLSHKKLMLVHLNTPDSNVKLGGHLDRHNSSFSSESIITVDVAKRIMATAPELDFILERRDLNVIKSDLESLRA